MILSATDVAESIICTVVAIPRPGVERDGPVNEIEVKVRDAELRECDVELLLRFRQTNVRGSNASK